MLIAEIHNIQRWQQQAEARVESLEDDLAHLVSSRKMLVLQRILLKMSFSSNAASALRETQQREDRAQPPHGHGWHRLVVRR